MTAPPDGALPDGFVVRLSRETWVRDGGVLVGGWPKRLARLTPRAADLLAEGRLTVRDTTTRVLAEHLLATGLGIPDPDSLPTIPLSELTVVIPTRDRAAGVARLLASLPRALAHVVVVDDGSRDPSAVSRVVAGTGAELVAFGVNRGPAAARNAGLARAGTAFVAFIDSDVEILAGSLEHLLRHFADPRLALAAPRILGRGDDGAAALLRYENARSSLDLGTDPAPVRPRSAVAWVSTTCVIARVSAIGAGFDETMRAGEDVDLVWRLTEASWRVRYDSAVGVLHEHRARLRPWLRRKFFYGTGARRLAEKHPDAIAPAVLPPWGLALAAVALAQRWWSLPAGALLCGVVVLRVHRRLGSVPHRRELSLRLVGNGIMAVLAQTVALMLRHWWPLTALALPFSRRARRAALAAVLIDTVWEYRRVRPRLDPARFAVLRRLDDGAYGAGVWWASLRGRAWRALVPAITWRRGS